MLGNKTNSKINALLLTKNFQVALSTSPYTPYLSRTSLMLMDKSYGEPEQFKFCYAFDNVLSIRIFVVSKAATTDLLYQDQVHRLSALSIARWEQTWTNKERVHACAWAEVVLTLEGAWDSVFESNFTTQSPKSFHAVLSCERISAYTVFRSSTPELKWSWLKKPRR